MEFIEFSDKALQLVLVLSLAPLLASLIVGLAVSLFQALTQIQEQTLTFVPKIIAVVVVIMLTSGLMLSALSEFAIECFNMILKVSGK